MKDEIWTEYNSRLDDLVKANGDPLVDAKPDISNMVQLSFAAPALVITLVTGIGLTLVFSPFMEFSSLRKAATAYLFVSTALVFAAWSWYPRRNLRILEYWFDKRPKSARRSQLEFWAAVLIAVSLAGLLLTALWPIYYAFIFIAYAAVYFLGVSLLTETVRTSVMRLKKDVESGLGVEHGIEDLHLTMLGGYRAIWNYHLGHSKHYWRIGALGAAGVAGLVLAVLDQTGTLARGTDASAFVMGTALLVAEGVISKWRASYYAEEATWYHKREAIQQRGSPE